MLEHQYLYHTTASNAPSKLLEQGIQPPESIEQTANPTITQALNKTRPDDIPPREDCVYMSPQPTIATGDKPVVVVSPDEIPNDRLIYTGNQAIIDEISFISGLHEWDLGSNISPNNKMQSAKKYWNSITRLDSLIDAGVEDHNTEIVINGSIPSDAIINIV